MPRLRIFLNRVFERARKEFALRRERPLIAALKKEIADAEKNGKISFLVELQTTNEFFYLKPVLETLRSNGHVIVAMVRERVRAQTAELVARTFGETVKIVNIAWAEALAPVGFYLNATLSHDITVPKDVRYAVSFSHTITSKSKYDVFSKKVEQVTDVFVPGEFYLKDIETFCEDFHIAKKPRFQKVGCPKSDELFRESSLDKKKLIESLGLDPERKTVLYAPTWNTDASIFSWREDILSIPERHGVNLIVKIHPAAYVDKTSPKLSGGVDWERFFESEDLRKRRIVNAYQTDSPDLIRASDIAITDMSTIWIEFYFLRKPIVFLDTPKFFETHEKNSLGDFQDAYGFLVKDGGELQETLAALLAGAKPPKNAPRIDEQLLYNRGHATEAAVAKIEELWARYEAT